jgi:HD-like signal output (HDOD) protein
MPFDTSTAFYDVMFDSKRDQQPMNLLEERALEQVRTVLNDPDCLNEHIPTLPAMLIKLLETLKNPYSDVYDFVDILEQDPAFATEVLRVANSARYCQSDKEVRSLRRAVSLLGLAGLSKIATTLLMANVIPCKPIYYKMFGRQIWVHSMHCATLCELLADSHGEDEFDAYFIGLIHDVGKIVIFNCLCEALGMVMIDCAPGSKVFKNLMSEMSADISYFIASEWQLPAVYCQALAEQSKNKKQSHPLAKLLYKANKLSEVYLMQVKGLVTEDELDQLFTLFSFHSSAWQQFSEIAAEIDTSVS